MRYFLTGDIHGNLSRIYNWINKYNFNYSDITIIIAGDAGICWRKDKRDLYKIIENHETKYLFNIWFIDGNHENFDILNSFIKENNDGLVKLSSHIAYIPRGTLLSLNINNDIKKVLFCGGADSIDKYHRTKHLDWWSEETISAKDIEKCLNNTKDTEYVDYIITHCCPYEVFKNNAVYLITLSGIDQGSVDHESEKMLDVVAANIKCNKHFFGHYHIDKQLDNKYRCVFNDFIEL